MRRFLLWLLVTAGLFVSLAVPYHVFLRANPRKVAVSVDTSFEMASDTEAVAEGLRRLASARYSVFSLATDKRKIHGWQKQLNTAAALSYYGPRDLGSLVDPSRYPELVDADRIVVLTNAPETSSLGTRPRVSVISLP